MSDFELSPGLGTITVPGLLEGSSGAWTPALADFEAATRAAGGIAAFYGSARPSGSPSPGGSPSAGHSPVSPVEEIPEVIVEAPRAVPIETTMVMGTYGSTPYFNPFAGAARPLPKRTAPPPRPRRSPPKPTRTRPTRPGTRPPVKPPVRFTPAPRPSPSVLPRVLGNVGRVLSRAFLPLTLLLHPLRSGPKDEYPTGAMFPGFAPLTGDRNARQTNNAAGLPNPAVGNLGTVVISAALGNRASPNPFGAIVPEVVLAPLPGPLTGLSPIPSAGPRPLPSSAPRLSQAPSPQPVPRREPGAAKSPLDDIVLRGPGAGALPTLGPQVGKTVCSCKTVDPNKKPKKKKKKQKAEEPGELEVEFSPGGKLKGTGKVKVTGKVSKYCIKPKRGKSTCL